MKTICRFFNLFIAVLCFLLPVTAISDGSAKQKVYVLPVSGPVDPGMAAYIERNLNKYAKDPEALVILEMDTFGGRVDSALEIVDHITNIPKSKVISFVSKRAISAGALIALAADDLVMKHNTMIGDCAPIVMSAEGPKMLGEKTQSPLRAKFRGLAKRNGYPELLSESMVSIDMEVYEIVFTNGKRTMDAVAYADMTPVEKERIVSRKTIVAKGELLTMDNIEAEELGFSDMSVANIDEMLKARGVTDYGIIRIQESWSETFVRYIGSIAQILMMIGLAALYLEYKSPGFGIFGIVGIGCLALVFLNQYLVGLADYSELMLLVIGILLLAVEIFVLPGFGIAGFAGLLTIGISLILMMQDFVIPDPSLPWELGLMLTNMLQVLVSFLLAFILTLFVFRYILPRLSIGSRGPFLSNDLRASRVILSRNKGIQVGDVGRADSLLRPSGKVVIGKKRLDAVSVGEFIESGTPIEITKIDGNRIIVKTKS